MYNQYHIEFQQGIFLFSHFSKTSRQISYSQAIYDSLRGKQVQPAADDYIDYTLSIPIIFKMNKFVVLAILLLATFATSQPNLCLLQDPATLRCQACNPAFQLDNQGNCKLYTPIEGCQIYDAVPTQGCFACAPSFLRTNGRCLAMLPNCASTTNVNTCDQCMPGFALVRFSSCLSTNTANCPAGSLPRTVNGISYCQQYSQINCIIPAVDGKTCRICRQGYQILNGICFQMSSQPLPCPNNQCQCQGYLFNSTCYAITLSNCLQSSDGIYCNLCADGYFISRGFCVKFVKPDDHNCNLLTLDGSRCSACNLNYVLDSNFYCVKDFQLCAAQACTSCAQYSNFVLFGGNCLPVDPLCNVFNFTTQSCILCQEGYALNPRTLLCEKKVTCLSKNQAGVCQFCFTGYQLDFNNVCKELPPNCLSMNVTSGVCIKCDNFTVLRSTGCVFDTTNCVQYNFFGRCQQCSPGFVEVRRLCVPVAANCQTFGVDQSVCSVCNQGYHIWNNLCYVDVEGCVNYIQKSGCSQCATNYQLINGKCVFKDAKCIAQDINGLCLSCIQGFIPSKGHCVYFNPFCLSYDISSVCTQAIAGFSVGAFSVSQQLAYLNFVQKAQAANGAALNADFIGAQGQGSYSKNGFILQLPYSGLSSQSIARYNLNGIVTSCSNGWTLNNGQCVRQAANCHSYNQYGGCLLCNPGFDLIADGSCATRSSSSCQQEQGGACTIAAQGFIVYQGSAIFAGNNAAQVSAQGLVVKANAGYFVWSQQNIAWPLDSNCLSQFIPGQCKSCAIGYSLWNNKCVLLKTNCLAYSSLGLCMGCTQGYLLWAGECRPSHCQTIQHSSGYCLVCQTSFSMHLGVCLPPSVANCQIYSQGKCQYCLAGYYLTSSGLCSKMIANCRTANPQTGRCLSCVDNYTLYSQQCIRAIANCQVYGHSLGSCSSCAPLYFPVNNGLICGYLGTNCQTLSSEFNCSNCKPGFTLLVQNNTQICVRPISNCFRYDNKANCIQCNSFYVLQFNRCKSLRCQVFVPFNDSCTKCYAPFVLSNNFCQDPNCQTYNQQTCIACLPRYYLSNGLCTLINDPNCAQVALNGTCTTCMPGFVLNSNGWCVSDGVIYNGCARQEYPCTKCLLGYELRADGLCWARRCWTFQQNRDCITCYNYYQLESTKRFCVLYTCASPSCYLNDNPPEGFFMNGTWLNITYCLSYNQATCTSCSDYRFPNPTILFGLCFPHNCQTNNLINCNGQCLSLFSNVNNYPGSCLADNCLTHSNNGTCLQCVQNFTLKAGTCSKIVIQNCLTIDYINQRCQVCAKYYDLWQGKCRASNCSNFGSLGMTCLTCQNGYVFTGKRVCQPGKCANVVWPICSQCIPGYELINGLCYARNCKSFDNVRLVCIQCQNYFSLVPSLGICQPSNCASYDANLMCKQCNPSFYLKNGVCIRCQPNCLACDSQGNCTSCQPNLIPIGPSCLPKVPGCSSYSPTGCSKCAIQYNLINGLCRIKYCQNYTTPDFCLNCQPRYRLQNGTCYPKNCINFNQATWQCSGCQPRFQLIQPFCFTYNCSSYNFSNYICSICDRGFVLLEQTCTFSNCLNPRQTNCTNCLPGFDLINGLCFAPNKNCISYDNNLLRCKQCAQGWKLNPYGLCIRNFTDPYCLSVDPQTKQCLTCLPSFNYNQGSQQCQNKFCVRFNPNIPQRGRQCVSCLPGFTLSSSPPYCIAIYCLRYDLNSGHCWACKGGSSLNQNVCFANNCKTYSNLQPTSPVCQSCNDGYQLNQDSLCVPKNCKTYKLDLSCSTCQPGFALSSNGLCTSTSCPSGFIFQNFQCVPANCQTYTKADGGCSVCLPGFVQEGRSCVAQGCLKYDNSYKCLQCAPGFSLNIVNGQALCVLTNPPICSSGYYFSDNSCIAIPISNCSVSDPTGKICYQCLQNFILRNNICYLIDGCIWPSFISGCRQCISGFVLNGFLCVSLNCRQINPNNTCKNCFQGYSLVNGVCRRQIYKCQSIDVRGNCLRCASGFTLRDGGICIAIGCQSYHPSTNVCYQCLPNYTLNQFTQTCEINIPIPHCFKARDSVFCEQCNIGYVQLSGKCHIQINWCQIYVNSTGLCQICLQQYYVNTQGQCAPLPSHCQIARPNGTCVRCVAGYRVLNGQCMVNIQNCQRFNPTNGVCILCIPRYYLTASGQCQILPAFCTQADPTGACSACVDRYSLVAGKCVPSIANCQIYNSNNPQECFQCFQGYYLNLYYTCTILPPFCLSANGLGACLSCVDKYQLVESICVIPVPQCISYYQTNNSTRCSQCAQGYSLTANFTCTSQLPPHCIEGSPGLCRRCIIGYRVYQSICVLIIPNCRDWNTGTLQCSNCQSGYYLASNGNNFQCNILPRHCIRADVYGNCLACANQYIIYNRQCVDNSSIAFCQVYDLATFTCQQCIPGYNLNPNSRKCFPQFCQFVNNQGQCTQCIPQYRLYNGLCVRNVTNCNRYLNGRCVSCIEGYVVEPDGLACKRSDPWCIAFAPDGTCTQCRNGYYLRDRCYLLPPGCVSIGNNGLCASCLSQFVLFSGTCIRRIEFCSVYNTSGCALCNQNYYLFNNICKAYPDGCLSYDPSSARCLSCASNYELNQNTWICTLKRDNCLSYNQQNLCIYCAPRFYLSNGKCFSYPPYCVTVDLLGNCISCAFGSILRAGSCQPSQGRNRNCLRFDHTNSICLICIQGYQLCQATGLCLRPDPGCNQFSNQGQCIDCKQPYVLKEGQCLLYPPGVIVLPNGGISCRSGYSLFNNSCLKQEDTLTPVSNQPQQCQFEYSSGNTGLSSFIGSNAYWSPSQARVNEYLSMKFVEGKARIIFQVGVRGNRQGWVSGYVLYYRNKNDAPLICWDGCNMVVANTDGESTSWLKLFHPIIATELRIYPVRWVGALSLQVDLSMLSFE